MRTITYAVVLSATLLVTTITGYAKTEVDPQLVTLNNKMSLVFQLPPQGDGKVLVKLMDDTETTLNEVAVNASVQLRKAIHLPLLEPGIYYLETIHEGLITRKELLIRWDSIEVTKVTKMKSELLPIL